MESSLLVLLLSAVAAWMVVPAADAQLICEQDPGRTFAGDDNEDCLPPATAALSAPGCGPEGGGCSQFDGDPTGCDGAFALSYAGTTSCWYDDEEDECEACDRYDEGMLRCTNTCNPVTCLDGDRTLVGGREDAQAAGAVTSGSSANNACSVFDGDPSGCEGAFVVDNDVEGGGAPVSCSYDDQEGVCFACGRSAEEPCTNECLPTPSCEDSSRTFAGGPGEGREGGACRQFENPLDCASAFVRNGEGHDVSCYWEENDNRATTSGGGGGPRNCRGCTRYNEGRGECVNTCRPTAVCEEDSTRTQAPPLPMPEDDDDGPFGSSACLQFSDDPEACEGAFTHDWYGTTTSCSISVQCSPCGDASQRLAVGALTSGFNVVNGCINDCVEPPPCDDSGRIFVGGPRSEACRQFAGDQTGCEASYALSFNGPVSCYYDDEGECRGCGPNSGDCTNACVAQTPASCPADSSRTLFAAGPDRACREFDGDEASCNMAFARRRNVDEVVSCYYSGGDCRGCGPNNQYSGNCINTCNPVSCEPNSEFAGYGCSRFNGQQESCEDAFAASVYDDNIAASCWYDTDTDSCRRCSPQEGELAGDCTNECASPTCERDGNRDIYTGGVFQGQACRVFDGDPTQCARAFAVNNEGQSVSCFYDVDDEACRGCNYPRQTDGQCSNSCAPPPVCTENPGRTILSDCFSLQTEEECAQGFALGPDGPVSCVSETACASCTLEDQAAGRCTNECFETVTEPDPTPTATPVPGPDGSTCMSASECSSGNCVNQICCDTPCDGRGEFCGEDGVCAEAPAAPVPAASAMGVIGILVVLLSVAAFALAPARRRRR